MKNFSFVIITVLSFFLCFTACGGDSGEEAPYIEMAEIPAGEFIMGSPGTEAGRDNNRGEGPRHRVVISGFRMGKYPVTQAQYLSVTGTNPSWFTPALLPGGVDSALLPVEQVCWYDAVEFCNRLSANEGRALAYNINKEDWDPDNHASSNDNKRWTVTLKKGSNGYRLPTEAQWEYACRAGTDTPFNLGPTVNTNQVNFNGSSYLPGDPGGVNRKRTTEVGSLNAPNAWGLHDMHGNVYEWCWDWMWYYRNQDVEGGIFINYYETAPDGEKNPVGLSSGDRRAERGGSWKWHASNSRSAFRETANPGATDLNDVGFRVTLPLPGSAW